MPKKIEMPGRHPSVDVEADIARLFSGLTLPETGISKGWLTDIKILRGVVTNIESNRGYGFGVTSLVARLAGGLRGSGPAPGLSQSNWKSYWIPWLGWRTICCPWTNPKLSNHILKPFRLRFSSIENFRRPMISAADPSTETANTDRN